MKLNIVFYFSSEVKNSFAALFAGIKYFCKNMDMHIHCATSIGEILKSLVPSSINLITFSITTVNFYHLYSQFLLLKEELEGLKNIFFVAGGPHADGDPYSLLNAGFDYVFSGYSEEGFPLFLEMISTSESMPERQIIFSKTSTSWHKRSFAKLFGGYFPPLEIQRGCRFRCNYCQSCTRLNDPIYKSREAIDEYIEEFHSLGFKRFSFVSPDAFDIRFYTNNRSPENISALFEYLRERGVEIIEYGQFPSEIRPCSDTDKYFLILAKYTKNRKIVIGAQSFSDDRLRVIRRSHTFLDIEATLEAAHRNGFYSIVDIIVGFPDETEEERIFTLNKFRELNKKYKSRLHVHYFLPLAGTEMYWKNPSPLDPKTLILLDKLEKDGRAKGWWKEGEKMVNKIIKMRDKFSHRTA